MDERPAAKVMERGSSMLITYIVALLGIFRFRKREYWTWIGVLFAWMLGAQLLFAGDGTLEDPSGDGLIAHQIRIATNDGPGMGMFAIVFLAAYWGATIWIIRKLYLASKKNPEREWHSDVEVSAVRRFVEAAALTLVAAAYVYLAFISPRMAAESMARASSDQTERQASDPIARELSRIADEITSRGPRKLDPITTLVRASANGRVLTYHNELSRRDGTDDQLRSLIRRKAVTAACNNPDMHKAMKDYGITYRYSYVAPNADAPVAVDATYEQCRALGLGE